MNTAPTPRLKCVVCHDEEPDQDGQLWVGLSVGFRRRRNRDATVICKHCVRAGRFDKQKRKVNQPPVCAMNTSEFVVLSDEYGSTGIIQNPRLCACGCGRPTPFATRSDKARGSVQGEQTKCLHGHVAVAPAVSRMDLSAATIEQDITPMTYGISFKTSGPILGEKAKMLAPRRPHEARGVRGRGVQGLP